MNAKANQTLCDIIYGTDVYTVANGNSYLLEDSALCALNNNLKKMASELSEERFRSANNVPGYEVEVVKQRVNELKEAASSLWFLLYEDYKILSKEVEEDFERFVSDCTFVINNLSKVILDNSNFGS